MKTGKRAKKGYAFALAAAIFLAGMGIVRTQAAGGIEADRDCSLTVSVEIGRAEGANDAYLEDFNQMSVPVAVYQVAEVDITGQKFTPVAPFTGLDFSKISKEGEAAAADWQSMAQQAEAVRQEVRPEAAGNTVVRAEEGSTENARGQITGLKPGMYLVVPENSYNPDYTVQYSFAPYLTALPSSEYTLTGAGSDEWNYDTTIGLKPDAVPLYGRLNITKNLQNYNETLGRTTFVFRIVGVDKNNVTKYEEVESLSFTAPGSQTVTLEGIPAGLKVTVTEIYSGASYQVQGPDEAVTLIVSDEAVRLGGQAEASVAFTNRYDGGNRGGYGVTNHFESDGEGGWNWENPTSPVEEAGE